MNRHAPDTNDHYGHFGIEPSAVKARRGHLELLVAAINTCKLKSTTARALTAIYTLDAEERHVGLGAKEGCACEDLVDGEIKQNSGGQTGESGAAHPH